MKKLMTNKKLFISILVMVIVISGSLSLNLDFFNKDIAEAKSVSHVLDIMGKNNPINIALAEELKQIEVEKIRLEEEAIAKANAEEERKRLELEIIELEREIEFLKDPNSKIAYLTFDDGPSSETTPKILDILKEHDIKATFFVVGYMAERYPDILKRTVEEGHKIGNHSYSHNYGYIYKNTTNFMRDINLADQVLKSILGEDFETKIMRFPGGSFGKHKSPMKKIVMDSGYMYFDWNSLNGDAEGILLSKEYLVKRLKQTVKGQKRLIVLMHDTDVKTTTVDSLEDIIEHLRSEGYVFRVLDENFNNGK